MFLPSTMLTLLADTLHPFVSHIHFTIKCYPDAGQEQNAAEGDKMYRLLCV